ncbi:flagellar biosynthesis anti-sigma factor FlgM [Aquifex aeolicus]|uniref:Anti sigma factor FlgM n=1 Tax=Aquifex aeolicus (strain VF5) TaxID=224324 RepID=O66683_AQUAE|nr:flagellar biosynthesis anti-sigma factor FlgM [Aquifex aeolicus]1RP3_B Chain B, anti sigma factor FlgM [Aquifex aeolicus]1RP3_D Chain D, anti sigma factor FlgM [Aquifex aeolicus]1RP3_F Chain F, anti sigma factor FlgM [Aquifex aeolicus]1RP3_H Chain H, anti sigma factor FlgM [Aquifex aeolicus]1SC5_B Chain B, anti-sigma factor FlgM [Aquifex aeolicus]AAC06641.1 anti sigma factor FlgM [Aquifex aeolicus VF5]
MVNRIELSRLIGLLLETEKRKNTEQKESGTNKIEDKVTLSKIAQELSKNDVEEKDLEKKVKELKEKIEKGEYEVSDEKVVKGLIEFFT